MQSARAPDHHLVKGHVFCIYTHICPPSIYQQGFGSTDKLLLSCLGKGNVTLSDALKPINWFWLISRVCWPAGVAGLLIASRPPSHRDWSQEGSRASVFPSQLPRLIRSADVVCGANHWVLFVDLNWEQSVSRRVHGTVSDPPITTQRQDTTEGTEKRMALIKQIQVFIQPETLRICVVWGFHIKQSWR